ncbi:MAG: leucine-rich repeat protein, partial [Clostridia bacterium]|nr:leucine-rich repeat protein [Clostridia bacterium]
MNARNKRLKRITVGLLMALVMVVSMLPMSSFTAFAADATVTDTAADTTYPYAVVDTAAGTVTIDGALGGKTTAEESDITALVDAIKGYVDSEITTIIVTGSKSPIIDMGNYTTTAIGEAIYRLSGSGTYDADNQYNGKIDLILSDVTEIIEYEFQNAYALNSITLPNVTKLGYRAFENCQYLKEITFGSVVEEGSPAGDDFKDVGTAVGGCDLVLNHGQQDAETEYQANLADMLWWASTKWKSIFLNHFGGEATCAAQAVCVVCNNSYGELADHSFDVTTGFCNVCGGYQPAVDSNSDGYYEISNAGQLFWFANLVNNYDDEAQNPAANAILTENITVNQNLLSSLTYDENGAVTNGDSFRAWTPIGSVTNIYTGTFDGNNKTVSGLYFNDSATSYVGLFGWVGSGGTVKNVGVIDSYLSGYQGVGGVVGVNHGTVQSCYNSGTVSGSNYVGGVVGNNAGTVTNCYNTGTVSGSSDVGGVVGVNHGTVQSCYNTGAVTGGDYSSVGGVVGGNVGTVQNCYYNTETYTGNAIGKNDGTVDALTGGKTAAQFASGEVAYLLQAGQTAGEDGVIPEVWGQNIKTSDTDTEYDAYPTLGGEKVYYGYNSCAETATAIYTNDSTVTAEKPTHSVVAATCITLAKCEKCGVEYGETTDPNNHASDEFTYTAKADGTTHTGTYKYNCCGAVVKIETVIEGSTATITIPELAT